MTTPFSPDSAARGSPSLSASAATWSARTSLRVLLLAVAVQRDRAADWRNGPMRSSPCSTHKLLIEQAPPQHDFLAGEFGIHLVGDARDGQAAVDADQAPLRLARESAKTLPGAHLADALGRQMRQPVVDRECGSELWSPRL